MDEINDDEKAYDDLGSDSDEQERNEMEVMEDEADDDEEDDEEEDDGDDVDEEGEDEDEEEEELDGDDMVGVKEEEEIEEDENQIVVGEISRVESSPKSDGASKDKSPSVDDPRRKASMKFAAQEFKVDIGDEMPVVRDFFHSQLVEFLKSLNEKNAEKNANEWEVVIHNKSGVLSLNMLEVMYISSNFQKKLKTRVEVATTMGYFPEARPSRELPKSILHDCAKENRHRIIISHSLIHNHGKPVKKCSKLEYDKVHDKLNIEFTDQSATPSYFALGNTTVLDFGRVVDWPGFHTNHQLYPVGFKCLRQEHDIVLDRVVDCLCEIIVGYEDIPTNSAGTDSLQNLPNSSSKDEENSDVIANHSSGDKSCNESKDEGKNSQELSATSTTNKQRIPIFRISVQWDLTVTSGKHVVRVYEGKTPQQVWQSVMLEGIGIKRTDVPFDVTGVVNKALTLQGNDESIENLEEQDDEERQMRLQLGRLRTEYLRLLKAEQNKKVRRPLQPRLPIENIDNVFDEYILRIVEGERAAFDCADYEFIDRRIRDNNNFKFLKVNYIKYVATMHTKQKHMERIIRKNLTLRILEQREQDEKLRIEEAEEKRRKAEEEKGSRIQRQVLYLKRKNEMREAERKIRFIREGIIKEIKMKREDARLKVEQTIDNEKPFKLGSEPGGFEESAESLSASISPFELSKRDLPLPSDLVVFPSDGFGKVLELYGYLATIISILDITSLPTVNQLKAALESTDPYMKNVYGQLASPCVIDSIDGSNTSRAFPSCTHAKNFLDDIGVALVQNLLIDFHSVIKCDLSDELLGGFKFEVNRLNWKEMGRVVLLHSSLKYLRLGDSDITAFVKGRGFHVVPDPFDKKILKLAKKRIECMFHNRHNRYRRNLYGFNSGLVIRIAAPSKPMKPAYSWQSLVFSLSQIPTCTGWLVRQVIMAAAYSIKAGGLKDVRDRHAYEMLAIAISPLYFRENNAKLSKSIAYFVLNRLGSSKSSVSQINLLRPPELDISVTALDAWNEQADRYYCTAKPVSYPSHFGEETDGWGLKGLRSLLSTIDSDQYPEIQCENDKNDSKKKGGNGDEEDNEEYEEEDNDEEENGEDGGTMNGNGKNEAETKTDEEIKDRKEEDDMEVQENTGIDEAIESDEVSNLSIAMQRCYAVMKGLMAQYQALDFLEMVNPHEHPLYYDYIRQPICLEDVRRCILSGGYKNSIYKFYKDVVLVFENAQVFNSESTMIAQHAQRMIIIFERMFYEMVLTYENPLSFHKNCHECKGAILKRGDQCLVCERCEACYHLQCVPNETSAASRPSTSEWLCNRCIEGRGVEEIHPYKDAQVVHPKHGACGQVVGVKQIKGNVRFLVEFENKKELWSGWEVRKCWASSHIAKDTNKMFTNSSIKSIPGIPMMPSGYFFDDFDKVCGLAAGYSGWGKPQCSFYPNDIYSQVAFRLRVEDVTFEELLTALAALGNSTCEEDFGYREWLALFNALSHRVLCNNIKLTFMPPRLDDKEFIKTVDLLDPQIVISRKNTKEEGDEEEDDEKNKKKAGIKKEEEAKEDEKNKIEDEHDEEDTDVRSFEIDADNLDDNDATEVVADDSALTRRRFRSNGCEDAMFSSLLMEAVAKQIDLKDDEDELEKQERGVDPNAPSQLMTTVIRTCAPKPSINANAEHEKIWLDSMNRKLVALDEQDSLPSDQIARCDFCGYDERSLASCFVQVETRSEWDKRVKNDPDSADTTRLFLPYDKEIAADELKDFESVGAKKLPQKGSAVAHEICVDTIINSRTNIEKRQENLRKLTQEKQDKLDNDKINEIMTHLYRVRNGQIGTDSCGNSYWIFCGSRAVYVSRPFPAVVAGLSHGRFKIPAGTETNFAQVLASSNAVDILSTRAIVNGEKHDLAGYGDEGYFSESKWVIYEKLEDIGRLINWLNPSDPCERLLTLLLKRLFPEAPFGDAVPAVEIPKISPEVKELLDDAMSDFISSSSDTNKNFTDSASPLTGVKRDRSDDNLMDEDYTSPKTLERLVRKNEADSSVPSSSSSSRADFEMLKEGTKVSIKDGRFAGKILEKKIDANDRLFYKIRFDNWDDNYDSWIPELEVSKFVESDSSRIDQYDDGYQELSNSEWMDVEYVKSLNALNYLHAVHRFRGRIRQAQFIPSHRRTDLDIMKLAMLTVEAALPDGAIDVDADDKWGGGFQYAWREAVVAAENATDLMACQIMLEYGIKTTWLKPQGLRLLSALPSRVHCMKFASVGQLALRLSALDQGIRYPKIKSNDPQEDAPKPARRGRPPNASRKSR